MTTWIVVIGVLLLAAAAGWVWYCREPGPEVQPPSGVPEAGEGSAPRAEQGL